MEVYKIAGNITSTGLMASIDAPADGRIRGVLLTVDLSPASGADCAGNVEVSFSSSAVMGTNDARAAIVGAYVRNELTTSGSVNPTANVFVGDLDITVLAGERLYMHGIVAGSPTVLDAQAYVYIDTQGAGARPQPRRR